MRAVHVTNGEVNVGEVPDPSGDGVRVRVRSSGICGSDLHMMRVGFPVTSILGHEVAGELQDGTPVAVEPLGPCGHCEFCVTGDYNFCVAGPEMVYGVGRDGGMADEILVPERCIVRLPAGVRAEDACLVEPLAVAVHGLRNVGVRAGHRVAIVGGGSIGLCALAVATESGAEATLIARHDAQRAAALRLGAQAEDGTYDIVIDAAGTTSALEKAVELCRPGGTLLLLASYWDGVLTLPAFAVCSKEIRIVPSMTYRRFGIARDIDIAAALLGARPEIPEVLISHRMPLDAAPEAFRIAGDRKSGAIKVVLEP